MPRSNLTKRMSTANSRSSSHSRSKRNKKQSKLTLSVVPADPSNTTSILTPTTPRTPTAKPNNTNTNTKSGNKRKTLSPLGETIDSSTPTNPNKKRKRNKLSDLINRRNMKDKENDQPINQTTPITNNLTLNEQPTNNKQDETPISLIPKRNNKYTKATNRTTNQPQSANKIGSHPQGNITTKNKTPYTNTNSATIKTISPAIQKQIDDLTKDRNHFRYAAGRHKEAAANYHKQVQEKLSALRTQKITIEKQISIIDEHKENDIINERKIQDLNKQLGKYYKRIKELGTTVEQLSTANKLAKNHLQEIQLKKEIIAELNKKNNELQKKYTQLLSSQEQREAELFEIKEKINENVIEINDFKKSFGREINMLLYLRTFIIKIQSLSQIPAIEQDQEQCAAIDDVMRQTQEVIKIFEDIKNNINSANNHNHNHNERMDIDQQQPIPQQQLQPPGPQNEESKNEQIEIPITPPISRSNINHNQPPIPPPGNANNVNINNNNNNNNNDDVGFIINNKKYEMSKDFIHSDYEIKDEKLFIPLVNEYLDLTEGRGNFIGKESTAFNEVYLYHYYWPKSVQRIQQKLFLGAYRKGDNVDLEKIIEVAPAFFNGSYSNGIQPDGLCVCIFSGSYSNVEFYHGRTVKRNDRKIDIRAGELGNIFQLLNMHGVGIVQNCCIYYHLEIIGDSVPILRKLSNAPISERNKKQIYVINFQSACTMNIWIENTQKLELNSRKRTGVCYVFYCGPFEYSIQSADADEDGMRSVRFSIHTFNKGAMNQYLNIGHPNFTVPLDNNRRMITRLTKDDAKSASNSKMAMRNNRKRY